MRLPDPINATISAKPYAKVYRTSLFDTSHVLKKHLSRDTTMCEQGSSVRARIALLEGEYLSNTGCTLANSGSDRVASSRYIIENKTIHGVLLHLIFSYGDTLIIGEIFACHLLDYSKAKNVL